MKKTTLLLSCLFTLLSFAAFGQEFPPSWYSEDVTVSETTMTRKNKNGDWVEFVDKTFTACAEVKVQDDIYSLEMARDAAEELANKKLDSYLKSKKEKEA